MIKSGLVGLLVAASLATLSQASVAQVAGGTTLGVTVEQEAVIVNGWSVKKAVLGKHVVNEKGEQVGTIDDIIIAPEGSVRVTGPSKTLDEAREIRLVVGAPDAIGKFDDAFARLTALLKTM